MPDGAQGPFAVPGWWMAGAHLGRVVSVQDPQSLSRVQITLFGADADGAAPVWARVAVAFAGDNRGAFLLPDVGDEVLVVFPGNDPRHPIVVGALWNGATAIPETIGGDRIDRWTITGKAGTRIAILEAGNGQETVEIETPAGAKARITDASGGSIRLEVAGNTFVMDTQGISLQTSAKFKLQANQVEMTGSQVKVDTPLATYSGGVKSEFLQSTSVIATSYTPGAGNVW